MSRDSQRARAADDPLGAVILNNSTRHPSRPAATILDIIRQRLKEREDARRAAQQKPSGERSQAASQTARQDKIRMTTMAAFPAPFGSLPFELLFDFGDRRPHFAPRAHELELPPGLDLLPRGVRDLFPQPVPSPNECSAGPRDRPPISPVSSIPPGRGRDPSAGDYLPATPSSKLPCSPRVLRKLEGCPVDRDSGGGAGLKAIFDRLLEGGIILLFPEGTRLIQRRTRRAKPGVGLVVIKSAAPVVPVRVFAPCRLRTAPEGPAPASVERQVRAPAGLFRPCAKKPGMLEAAAEGNLTSKRPTKS